MFNTRISYRVCFISQHSPYEPNEFPSPSMFRIYIGPADTPVLFPIINQLESPSPLCLFSKQLIIPLSFFSPFAYAPKKSNPTSPIPSYSNLSCSTSQQLKGDPRHRQAPSLLLSSLPSQPTQPTNPSHLISSHLISSHLTSSHLISSHLISSHLIPPHLISSHSTALTPPYPRHPHHRTASRTSRSAA